MSSDFNVKDIGDNSEEDIVVSGSEEIVRAIAEALAMRSAIGELGGFTVKDVLAYLRSIGIEYRYSSDTIISAIFKAGGRRIGLTSSYVIDGLGKEDAIKAVADLVPLPLADGEFCLPMIRERAGEIGVTLSDDVIAGELRRLENADIIRRVGDRIYKGARVVAYGVVSTVKISDIFGDSNER